MSINNFPDNSTIRFTSLNLGRFIGEEINNSDANKLNTIFQECNTEKNAKGEVDDVLSVNERFKFLDRVKNELAHLFQKVVDFTITVEVSEDLARIQEDAQKTEVNK